MSSRPGAVLALSTYCGITVMFVNVNGRIKMDVVRLLECPREMDQFAGMVLEDGEMSNKLIGAWAREEFVPVIVAALDRNDLGLRAVAFCLQILNIVVIGECREQREDLGKGFRNLFYAKVGRYWSDALVMVSFSRLFAVLFGEKRGDAAGLLTSWFFSDYEHRVVSVMLGARLVEDTKSSFGLETYAGYVLHDLLNGELSLELMGHEIDFLSACFEHNATARFVDAAVRAGVLQVSKIFERVINAPNSFKTKLFGVFKEFAGLLFFSRDMEMVKGFVLESLSVIYHYINDQRTSDSMVRVISSFWTSLSSIPVLKHMEIPDNFTDLIKHLTARSLTQEMIVEQPVTVENLLKGWVNLGTPTLNETMVSVLLQDGPLQGKMLEELAQDSSAILEQVGKALFYDYQSSASILSGAIAESIQNSGLPCLIMAAASMVMAHQYSPVDEYIALDVSLAQQIALTVTGRKLPSPDFGIPTTICQNGFFESSICEFCEAIATVYCNSNSEHFRESMLIFYTHMLILFRCQILATPLMRRIFSALSMEKIPVPLKISFKDDPAFRSFLFDLDYPFVSDEAYLDEASMWIGNVIVFAETVSFEQGIQVVLDNAMKLQNEFISIQVFLQALKHPSAILVNFMLTHGIFGILKDTITGHRHMSDMSKLIERLASCVSFPTMSLSATEFAHMIMDLLETILHEISLAEPEHEEIMGAWIARTTKKLVDNPMLNFGVMQLFGDTTFSTLFNHFLCVVAQNSFIQMNVNVCETFFDLVQTVYQRFDNLEWIDVESTTAIITIFSNVLELFPLSTGIRYAFNCLKMMFTPFDIIERLHSINSKLTWQLCTDVMRYRFAREVPKDSYPPVVAFVVIELMRLECEFFQSALADLSDFAINGCEDTFAQIFDPAITFDETCQQAIVKRIEKPMEILVMSALLTDEDCS